MNLSARWKKHFSAEGDEDGEDSVYRNNVRRRCAPEERLRGTSECQDGGEVSDIAGTATLGGIVLCRIRGGEAEAAAVQSDPAQVAVADKGGYGVLGDGRVVPVPEEDQQRIFRTSSFGDHLIKSQISV